MVASLYPEPLARRRDDRARRASATSRDQRTQKLSGGQTQRVRFAIALVTNPDLLVLDEPTVAMDVESRHAFWTTMREFASRGKTVLLRDALSRGGGRLRRPRRSDGRAARSSPTGRRRRSRRWSGTRSIRATLPGVDARRARAAARRDAGRAPRRGGRARAAPTRTRRSARSLERVPRRARHRDQRRRPRRGVPRADDGGDMTRARLRQVRAAAHVPQPAVHLPLARLPARPLLPDRGAEPQRVEPRRHRASPRRSTSWSASPRSAA